VIRHHGALAVTIVVAVIVAGVAIGVMALATNDTDERVPSEFAARDLFRSASLGDFVWNIKSDDAWMARKISLNADCGLWWEPYNRSYSPTITVHLPNADPGSCSDPDEQLRFRFYLGQPEFEVWGSFADWRDGKKLRCQGSGRTPPSVECSAESFTIKAA
jgi:hypothetical protein